MAKRYPGLGVLLVLLCAGSAWSQSPPENGSRRARYAVPEDDRYQSPVQLLLSRDGQQLFVTCEEAGAVLVIDTRKRQVVGRLGVGQEPFGLALSPDERRLYVSLRGEDEVAVVDLSGLQVEARVRVGNDPHALIASPDGKYLFAANLGTDDLSVVECATRSELKRLSLGHGPFGLALSPDGGTLYASHQYSNPVPFRTPPVLELTAIDPEHLLVRQRRFLPSAIIAQGIAVSPDGQFVATALELPKNLLPETQLFQGWMVTYGFALSETRPGGRSAFLLIDEPHLYFADPYGLAFSPDGHYLYISSSGADVVSVVDMEKVYQVLQVQEGRIGASEAQLREYARHLGLSSEYAIARIPTGANPKGLAVSPDGRWVYAALRLADQIAVIDAEKKQVVDSIDLGGPQVLTTLRWGARLFNYASISFQRQLSCATCHPEYSVDGLNYDIAADGGMGHNLVDNMTLRGIADTAPFKWRGKNPTLQRQDGPRAAQLFFRTHGFEREENEAIVHFIESIPRRPNRYRQADGRPDAVQQLGKKLFERSYDNLGRYIPAGNRCVTCHPLPATTDHQVHDIGSKNYHDRDGDFDTPHLFNVYERPPYMHDGRCYSLEEIWTRFNPDDTHGVTNEMTKDQLNALIEYLKTF